MERRQLLGALGSIGTIAVAGCSSRAEEASSAESASDPYADIEVVEEVVVDDWLIESTAIPFEETQVYDQETEELIIVEPERDLFVEIHVRVHNLIDEARYRDIPSEFAGLPVLVNSESYEPIEELPGGYEFEDQESGADLGEQPLTADSLGNTLDKLGADQTLIEIRVYDLPDKLVAVDTREIEGVDAVVAPEWWDSA